MRRCGFYRAAGAFWRWGSLTCGTQAIHQPTGTEVSSYQAFRAERAHAEQMPEADAGAAGASWWSCSSTGILEAVTAMLHTTRGTFCRQH